MTGDDEHGAAGGARRDRRTTILDAAATTLLRYGFRKASVDEVARQAGISRQGLYLHFPTKDALFAATVDHLLTTSVTAARTALETPGAPLRWRLLAAFEAIAGDSLAAQMDELLDTAERLTGRPAAELEGEIVAEFTRALEATPASSPWRRHGDEAESVATVLYATSAGLKRVATSLPDYTDRMRTAIRFVCDPRENEDTP